MQAGALAVVHSPGVDDPQTCDQVVKSVGICYPEDHRETARALNRLAWFLKDRGLEKASEAEAVASEATEMHVRLFGKSLLDSLRRHRNLREPGAGRIVYRVDKDAAHADDGRLAGSPGGLVIRLYQHHLDLGHPGEARQLI